MKTYQSPLTAKVQIPIYLLTGKKNLSSFDPNDWSEDHHYIIDLVKRVVRVSVETMKIVNNLPALNESN